MLFYDLTTARQSCVWCYIELGPKLGIGLLFTLLLLQQAWCVNAANQTPTNAGINDALLALQKAALFYTRNFEKVNLDSIFGVRVAQGSLYYAINSMKSRQSSSELLQTTEKIYSKLEEAAEKGYQELKASKSGYVEAFRHLIDKQWFYLRPYQNADKSKSDQQVGPSSDNDNMFDSGVSDECFSPLIADNESGLLRKCRITEKCLTLMTDKRASGYYLTHQALYMALADKQGCKQETLRQIGNENDWKKHVHYLGTKISLEMKQRFQQGFTAESSKDLFVEQIVVCQMLGILGCFETKYLSLVIQWQEDSGCWKEPASEDEKEHDTADETVDAVANNAEEPSHEDLNISENEAMGENVGLKDVIRDNGDENVIMRRISRRLQEEKILSDGCASHLTGVATGLLGMYVYWFSNPYKAESGLSNSNPTQFSSGIAEYNPTVKSQKSLSIDARWVFIFLFVAVALYLVKRRLRPSRRLLKRHLKVSL